MILISAVTIIALLVSVFGYFEYRKYISYKQGIHKNASLIIRINADQIYSKLFADYLGNFSYYRNRNRRFDSGLKIPANVFVYNISDRSFGTFFCIMPIENLEALEFFLKTKLKISKTGAGKHGFNHGISPDRRITVAYNERRIAIAYSFEKEALKQVLTDMLTGENLLQSEDTRLAVLLKSKDDVSYAYKKYTGSGNFDDGEITFKGDFNTTYLRANRGSLSHKKFNESAELKMWLNLDLWRLPYDKKISLSQSKFNIDSLLKYKVKYVDLEVDGQVQQQDSSVAYTYNDDFEKIATVTTRNVLVPNLLLSLRSDTGSFIEYLNRQHIILNTGFLNKTIFPLYDVYWFYDTKEFKLSTNKELTQSAERIKTSYFFGLEVDFESLLNKKGFSLNFNSIAALKSFTALAKQENSETNHFDAVLKFKKSHVNGLIQLL